LSSSSSSSSSPAQPSLRSMYSSNISKSPVGVGKISSPLSSNVHSANTPTPTSVPKTKQSQSFPTVDLSQYGDEDSMKARKRGRSKKEKPSQEMIVLDSESDSDIEISSPNSVDTFISKERSDQKSGSMASSLQTQKTVHSIPPTLEKLEYSKFKSGNGKTEEFSSKELPVIILRKDRFEFKVPIVLFLFMLLFNFFKCSFHVEMK